jgi:hypothetical protein
VNQNLLWDRIAFILTSIFIQVPKCRKKRDNKYYYVLSYVVLAYTCVSFQKLKYKFTYYYSDFENEI